MAFEIPILNPAKQVGVILVTNGRYRSHRRVMLSRIIDLIDGAWTSAKFQDEPTRQADILSLSEIVGEYFGNDSFTARVRNLKGNVIFEIRPRGGGRIEMRGSIDQDGHLHFKPQVPGTEPTFFRYARTGESCVMYGMYALKRLPVAVVD